MCNQSAGPPQESGPRETAAGAGRGSLKFCLGCGKSSDTQIRHNPAINSDKVRLEAKK